MILIEYTGEEDFLYDIQGIVRSFFPGIDMTLEHDSSADMVLKVDISEKKVAFELDGGERITGKTQKIDRSDRKDTKNILKRTLYDILKEYTGKTLPWGTLSGIRPTKITTELLKLGKSIDEIHDYIEKEYYLSGKKAELSINISKQELKILSEIDYKNGYSIYIGIPFCPSRCAYCSFTSYPLSIYKKKTDAYIETLLKELDFIAESYKDKKLNTIYIGGGTPTTLEPYQSDRLLTHIENIFDFSQMKEFTVEAGRPDSITKEKLEVIRSHPVTRISVNPQTMSDKTLQVIGRKHTTDQFYEAFENARDCGFDNINVDLIVGLPGEGPDEIKNTMEKISAISPESVTVHSLAIKRAARLNTSKSDFLEYSSVNSEEIMELTAQYTKNMGMLPYYLYRQKNMTGNLENVGYAKPGKEGIYNILIMEEKQSIIGAGAGAATKMVFPEEKDGRRIQRIENVKDVDCYIDRIDEMIGRKRNFIDEFGCF